MATYGNDTITGLAAGGLPDDCITNAEIADDAVQQAQIADEAVDEARIQISNAGSNGQFLQKQSGNTGGLTWATVNTSIADDSITEAKLDIHAAPSGTDKFLKYTSNGMEWAVDNGWAEHVYFNKDGDSANCATGTWAKVAWDAGYQRGTNTGSFSATNSRYTPGVAGWYLITAELTCHHNGSGSWWHIEIRKNGVGVGVGHSHYPHTVNGLRVPIACTGLFDMDSTDYVEVYINQSTGSTRGVDDKALTVVRVGTNS